MNSWLKVALWCIPAFVLGYGLAIVTGVIAMCSSDNPIGLCGLFISLLAISLFVVTLPVGLVRRSRTRKLHPSERAA